MNTTQNKNLFFKNVVEFCQQNSLELVHKKSKFNIMDEINKIDFTMKCGIRPNWIDEDLHKMLEENLSTLLMSRIHTKRVYCLWCPNSIYLVLSDNFMTCQYKHSYKLIDKWLKNIVNGVDMTECSICYETKDHFSYCPECRNPVCVECNMNCEKCPFCRR